MNGKNDKKENNEQQSKMTIYEYEEKYVKRQNVRHASFILKMLAAVIGIFLFTCLFLVALRVYDINLYAGIAVSVVCVVIYIFIFVVPLVKILKTDYFQTNVNSQSAREAKKHNRRVRCNIAEKMIDFNATVEGVGWYDDKVVVEMAASLNRGDDEGVKDCLTRLYADSVKKSARSIIVKNAVKSGMFSAVSQNNTADAAIIAVVNLQMIKDIVFLYGFRPSDARLVKIFAKVIQNSLVAYGLGSVKIGQGVAQTIGGAAKGIPILGSAISVLVDSSVQGLANGTLTAVIGYQTIKYLNYEYKLQNILDGVELEDTEEEFTETCEEVKEELKSAKNAKKAYPKAV
ncbi:MAG: YcjF family protein [Clostridia bacterium]|nr:YcjF family protein [Clostridia bacterium]